MDNGFLIKASRARNFVSKHSHNKSGAGAHKSRKGKASYSRKNKDWKRSY